MKDLILTSLSKGDLEMIVIDCLNAWHKENKPAYEVEEPTRDKEELLTKKEAAKLLKVSVSTISNYARRGMLEKHHVGRVVRFKREDVMAIASPRKVG